MRDHHKEPFDPMDMLQALVRLADKALLKLGIWMGSSPLTLRSFCGSGFHQYLKQAQIALLQGIGQSRHPRLIFRIHIGSFFD